jgi:hypothetical protein
MCNKSGAMGHPSCRCASYRAQRNIIAPLTPREGRTDFTASSCTDSSQTSES